MPRFRAGQRTACLLHAFAWHLFLNTPNAAAVVAVPAGVSPAPAPSSPPPAVVPGAAIAASPKPKWRATYPFPQCLHTTQSYDVSFVGPLNYIEVGPVKYAYHRFGPLSDKPNRVDIVDPIRLERAGIQAVNDSSPNSPLVFIPGLGMSMYMWPVPMLRRLADDRQVIIFDNMRSGLSTDNSNTTLSIQLMANSTMAFMTKLGLKQPNVYGWSIGGCVAYAILAYHSGKVDNVMIAAATPGGPDSYLPPQSVLDDILKIKTDYHALLPYLFPRGAMDDGVCGLYAAYNSFYNSHYTKLDRPISVKSLLEQGQAIIRFAQKSDVIDKLSSASNRVLIMHGVQDRLMPVRNAALADDLLLGSWMLQLPGEGHGILFSHLQAIMYLTQEFFSFATVMTKAELKQWDAYGVKVLQKAQQSGR